MLGLCKNFTRAGLVAYPEPREKGRGKAKASMIAAADLIDDNDVKALGDQDCRGDHHGSQGEERARTGTDSPSSIHRFDPNLLQIRQRSRFARAKEGGFLSSWCQARARGQAGPGAPFLYMQ